MEDPTTISDSAFCCAAIPETPPRSGTPPADGEIQILYQSLEDGIEWVDSLEEEEEEEGDPATTETTTSTTSNGVAAANGHGRHHNKVAYGHPLSMEEAAERMPASGGKGMVWVATIIPDEMFSSAKRLLKGLKPGDFDPERLTLKPGRPGLPVRASDFFSSLTRVGHRYIFSGVLNGWPGLTCLEVLVVEQKGQLGIWNKVWKSKEEGWMGKPLELPSTKHFYRAVLRGAPWTAEGWSNKSPGFVFWYESRMLTGPRISYGTNMLTTVDEKATCTYIHMVNHRYAVQRESPRDLLTYHSICLLEWDHGLYMTVLETAYLNGIGGYKGKCNWYHDKDEHVTQLYKMLPPEMILPWRTNSSEIRAYDVEARTLDDFSAYMNKYKGNTKRFIDPRISFSHPARLTFRTKRHVAQYLLNYISRDPTYADLRRNCQTFAADLCSFVAGKRDVPPFHPVSRIEYQNRTYLFLYDSHMYEKKEVPRSKSFIL